MLKFLLKQIMDDKNVNVNARWIMPKTEMIKVNVYTFFSEEAFPNGNHSGIGIVFRNSSGDIVGMIGGSLGFNNRRENEYNAFLESLKEAYFRDFRNIVLETDHVDSFWIGKTLPSLVVLHIDAQKTHRTGFYPSL